MNKKLEELYKKKAVFEEFGEPIPKKLLDDIALLESKPESITPIYDTLKANYPYDEEMPKEKIECIESSVEQLLADVPNAEEPGLLLGKIQCGKTDTFEDIIGLAFDKGIDIAVILTKGTIPLLEQTVSRIKRDYKYFKANDDLNQNMSIRIHDIHDIRKGILRPNVESSKTVIVCMKQDQNLKWLIDLFENKSPFLKDKKVIVVDDEADFASRNYQTIKTQSQSDEDSNLIIEERETTMAKISKKIDQFRKLPKYCRYLQVTATPYALFLQPNEELFLQGDKVLSFKPRFTCQVPDHAAYVGGKEYFEKSQNIDSMFSHLFRPITKKCIDVMRKKDMRYLNAGVSSVNLYDLTYALTSYMMATAIRAIQQREKGKNYTSSALIHVNISRDDHEWQYQLVQRLIKDIENYVVKEDNTDLRVGLALDEAYESFKESNRKGINENLINVDFPTKDEVKKEIKNILSTRNCHIQKVNSDEEVKTLLDEESGELRLDATATIFIGGNVLDRGITIKNMLCFFYGRNPSQQDSVLQHARFYGARSMEDMAVTRLNTTNEIYSILSRMHFLDEQLRKWFLEGKDKNEENAVFIGYDKSFKPCAASKIKVSNTLLIQPQIRKLPVGFWTGTRREISSIVDEIDNIITNLPNYEEKDVNGFFEINKDDALKIMSLIRETYVYDEKHQNKDHKNDISSLMCMIQYCTDTELSGGKLFCLHRTNRNMSRLRTDNGGFIDAPDDGRSDLAPARALAINKPVLMLLKQKGEEKRINGVNYGWNNTSFYWPVLVTQENVNSVMFAIDQKTKEDELVIDEKIIFGEEINPEEVLHLTFKGNLEEHFGPEGTISCKESEFQNIETREIKDTTAAKYLNKDSMGNWEINPNVNVDIEKYAGVYTYNNGVFPFVLKPYRYMLLRNGRSGNSDAMLLELTDLKDWEVIPAKNINEKGELLDRDHHFILHVKDIIRDRNLNEEEYINNNVCTWIIRYGIKRVVRYVPQARVLAEEE